MKRHIILLLVALVAVVAQAQIRWSAIAGANFETLHFKQQLIPVHSVVGYQAGVEGELMFPGIGFGMGLGLMYNQQGARVDLGAREVWAADGYRNPHIMMHYVTIPITLRFKWTRLNGLEDIIAPFVYGGPTFNFMVAHSKCDAMKYPGGYIALGVGGGFEIKRRWQVSGGYVWGMTYAAQTRLLDNFSARVRYAEARVAYFF